MFDIFVLLSNYYFSQIVGSLMEIHGTLEFYENEVVSLELLSSAQVLLKEGARMEFTKNTGRYALITMYNNINILT